jgi:putative PIN family toxin of toxin-antitoxin system
VRVVLDTNVFVSSFFGGNPRAVIDLWRHDRITLCLCPTILAEYLAVLRRLGLNEHTEMEDLLALFRRGHGIVFTRKTPNVQAVADDPDDDKFIACAVALHADVIVSGDRHLRQIGAYLGIRILSPAEFLRHVDQDTARS